MRLNAPRIEPVDMERLDEEQQAAIEQLLNVPDDKVGGGRVLNIFRTLLHAPKALAGFLAWGNYVLSRRNALPPREREMVILRTGWLCKSGYEFAQHTRIGKNCGLTDKEIARIKTGPDAEAGPRLKAQCCGRRTSWWQTTMFPTPPGPISPNWGTKAGWTSFSPSASTPRSR